MDRSQRNVERNSGDRTWIAEKERVLKQYRDGPFNRMLADVMKIASVDRAGDLKFQEHVITAWPSRVVLTGVVMEDIADLLKLASKEVYEGKAVLEEMVNDVKALSEVIQPALLNQIKELRAARMTLVSEVQQSLGAMKDVRKFFLESDYVTEMDRLERFIRMCREFQQLKSEGVLDAVCDSAIRLAVKERTDEGKSSTSGDGH